MTQLIDSLQNNKCYVEEVTLSYLLLNALLIIHSFQHVESSVNQ